jgi:putative glutamine amidotransferase
VLENTKLAGIAGALDAVVNSHHHQAIESVGADLIATAWTTDGVIEAMEDPRPDRFVMAVQWHPELGWETDGLSQRLFRRFVDEAACAGESMLASLSTPA